MISNAKEVELDLGSTERTTLSTSNGRASSAQRVFSLSGIFSANRSIPSRFAFPGRIGSRIGKQHPLGRLLPHGLVAGGLHE